MWEDLDVEGSGALVRDMKNPGEKIGNDIWCDLASEALQIILSMPKRSKEIFPYSGDTIGTNFTRACWFLNIIDLHLHDLRHDGVSRLFEMGANIEEAEDPLLRPQTDVIDLYQVHWPDPNTPIAAFCTSLITSDRGNAQTAAAVSP